MLNLSRVLFALILSTILFPSCKDNTKDSGPSKTDSFSVVIDGKLWTANITSWASSGGTVQLNSELKSDDTMLQIFMPEDTTGVFNAADNIVTVSYSEGNIFWSNEVSGSINVIQNSSSEIEGTFDLDIASSFNSDTLEFRTGEFYWKRN